MIVRSFFTVFSLLLATQIAPMAYATDAKQISQAVNQFLEEYSQGISQQYGDTARVEHLITGLDYRLKMAQCPEPLKVTLKSTKAIGRVNTQVSCDGDTVKWSLYVPVTIQVFFPVVSTKGPIAKDHALSASDLSIREMDISTSSGRYFSSPDEVIGMISKRTLSANQIIYASLLKPPIVIRRGDAVILSAKSGGLNVKVPGVALSDGRLGEQISVRNSSSKRVVEGEVIAAGQVAVLM